MIYRPLLFGRLDTVDDLGRPFEGFTSQLNRVIPLDEGSRVQRGGEPFQKGYWRQVWKAWTPKRAGRRKRYRLVRLEKMPSIAVWVERDKDVELQEMSLQPPRPPPKNGTAYQPVDQLDGLHWPSQGTRQRYHESSEDEYDLSQQPIRPAGALD